MFTTPLRLISNGRVTIPAEIRRQLELEEGDPIMITIESAGSD
jgi:AbrB family looped-hinge helix DNA binding protein